MVPVLVGEVSVDQRHVFYHKEFTERSTYAADVSPTGASELPF